jgi:hypothetical protein
MTRLIRWISNVIHDVHTEPEVHFHSGPYSTPVVCHDGRCAAPRLNVDEAG